MSKSSLVKLVAVVAGLILVPATAAHAAVGQPLGAEKTTRTAATPAKAATASNAECATVSRELKTNIYRVKWGLTAESPNRAALADRLKETQAIVEQAQADGCLPVISLRGEAAGCEADAEDLLGDLLAALGAVVSGVLDTALALVQAVVKALKDLLGGGCLPPAPTAPPTVP
jgi:hypothetical protein